MKAIKAFIVLLLSVGTVYAQTNCKPYVPTEKGTKWELTNYNSKGKIIGTNTYEVLDKVTSGNNTTFTIKTASFDKKGKEIYTNTFDAKCIDGVFEFDMSMKMDGASMQNFNNMDIEVDASKYEIPDFNAAPGTTLEDGNLKVSMAGGGLGLNMTISITDRKIEATESITTPAGTFNCIVLSQKISTKVMIRVQGSSKEWYAENVGLVRSESYNKKGKLIGYSELTMLEK
jgi:hypothetical protein